MLKKKKSGVALPEVKSVEAEPHPGPGQLLFKQHCVSYQFLKCITHTHTHCQSSGMGPTAQSYWHALTSSSVCDMKGCMCDIKTQSGSFGFTHQGRPCVCQAVSAFSAVYLTPPRQFAETLISQIPCHVVLACYCSFIPVLSLF